MSAVAVFQVIGKAAGTAATPRSGARIIGTLWEELPPEAGPLPEPSDPWGRWFGKLDKLRELGAGWDGYDAPAPQQAAIDKARALLGALRQERLNPDLLSPSSVGGVGVTLAAGGREAYVECYNDGRAYLLLSDGSGEPEISRIGEDKGGFRAAASAIRGYLDG